ncbi:MAG: colanic acid exporter [Methanobacterium sp. PtaB.Bin024]|nr:MAG: colanic acid exporter [Methanobacterium sp. PtaB.Bin024]
MNSVQRIAKNVGMSGISQIFTSLLVFVFLIYIARYFGEAGFGVFSFALSFSALFVVFADIGISQFVIREIARDKNLTNEYITNISIIKVLLSFLTFALIILFINLMHYPSNVVYLVYIFGIYAILTSFSQFFMSIFQAFEKMEYVAFLTVIEKIIIVLFGFLVIFWGYGLDGLAYIYVLAGGINVIISFSLVLMKLSKPLPRINFLLWKTITIKSIPFGLNTVASVLFFKIDTVLLSFMKDATAVGVYNAAYNPLLSFGTIVSTMVVSAIYPVMSRYFISSRDSLETFTILISKYMIIIGFPVAMGCFVLANQFIELFYGSSYANSVIAFQILAIFIPIRLVSSITGTLLTSINKQGIRTFGVTLAALFNIFLNIALIPSLSYVGASIVTVLSEIFLYFLYIIFISNYFKKLRLYNLFIKPLIASLIMGILVFYFREINLFLVTLFAILSYFIVLMVLRTFTKEDKFIFKQILGRFIN